MTAIVSNKKSFSAAIDRITSEIRRRFEQPGKQQLNNLERILTDAAEGRNFAANDLNELLGAHAADFDISKISAQLVHLPTVLRDEGTPASERILQVLPGKSADMRKMMHHVVQNMQLVFSVLASAASGEPLCPYTSKNIFAHLLLLHLNKRAAELHLDAIMKEFVSTAAERTATLGLL